MRSIYALLSLSVLLAACSATPIEVGGVPLVYDSGSWEYFSNDLGTGLNLKGDESCWIDLAGSASEPYGDMTTFEEGDTTYYYYYEEDALPTNISFDVGSETLYGRVGVDDPDVCVGELMILAESN